MIRNPAVAGHFYSGNSVTLAQDVKRLLHGGPAEKPARAFGVLCPHAGYIYSGALAAATLAQVEIPPRVVLLGPNHTGLGAWAAIEAEGKWRTPLGDVPIDTALAHELMELDGQLEPDTEAHRREHSLEVQLPLLQVLRPDVAIVPICLSHFSLAHCESLGNALARLIRDQENPPLLLASSDMNHYESQEITLSKDQMAMAAIEGLDPEELYRVVHEENISMCGVIPSTCLLFAARSLGVKQARLVGHATSGDVNGDYTAVVGYAGFVLS